MTSPAGWPPDTAVVIPAYRAADSLEQMLPRVQEQVPAAHLLIVDDGSQDATPAICREWGIQCVAHPFNRGKGAALRTAFGLLGTRYRWLVTMDADGQHDCDDLGSLTAAARGCEGCAICIGKRLRRPGTMPAARIFSNTVSSLLLSIVCRTSLSDIQCGFRVYRSAFVQTVPIVRDRFEMETEIIMRACHAGWKVCFEPVRTLYFGGQSHIRHLGDTLRWARCVAGVSRELRKKA